jgi:hypothetical protein
MDVDGLTVALDCAHGTAYQSAPAVFEELGTTVSWESVQTVIILTELLGRWRDLGVPSRLWPS